MNYKITNHKTNSGELSITKEAEELKKGIHTLDINGINCYLIRGKNFFLVDSGEPDSLPVFMKQLEHFAIKPQNIAYTIITHCHWDHIGSIGEIKKATNCKIFAHHLEKKYLEEGILFDPEALTFWGNILKKMTQAFYLKNISITGTKVDIPITSRILDMRPYGLQGKIIHTPGHSPGSISVLLDTGQAFVGDMAVNRFPMNFRPGLSPFGENLNQIKKSWSILLNEGARQIYPAHGPAFPVDQIVKRLKL